ncbi:UNVERIFIED_CONTAM: Geranylgeranyl transferase type-1 subunit beta [Sesamum latifolium]|uniref:Geranylgeranyl transferase type-1 subunit beta n=1 Tax=Sesamum latifolium TaxID=2727402 RepID=A0AAW2XT31_9LAMI
MEEQEYLESDPESLVFDRDRHIYYLLMMYQLLPSPYQGQEINRLTLAYFVISGLDILRALDRIDKEAVINWVLSLQAHPRNDNTLEKGQFYGFHGSRSSQFQSNNNGAAILNGSHLASTYCALAILKTVGYDLSLIDSELLLKSMKDLQQPDGCFMPIHTGGETDLRFVFCAAAICSMLENWSGMDREKAKEYIVNCQIFVTLMDGSSFSVAGGATSRHKMAAFKVEPTKPTDTCYAFWVGGVLRILGADTFINESALRGFLLTCQSEYGGFSKFPRLLPDLYHSYYGYCAYSLLKEPGLNSLCVELGITDIAAVGL